MDFAALTERIIELDAMVWQPLAMPVVLLLVGATLTLATGFVQIRQLPAAAKIVFKSAISREKQAPGTITPFQALTTALAATVGNGNIGGVATAILIGGPGAMFWMWMSGLLGMATKYAEAVLGVHHRVRRDTGELASGPMYYITRGIKNQRLAKPLAWAFAGFGALTALLGTGNMAQSNTVARTAVEALRTMAGIEVPAWVPGIVIAVGVGAVLLGGVQRIAATTEKLVPAMVLTYVVMGLVFLIMNIEQVPVVLTLIVSEAFTPTAAIGGFAGATMAQAIASGASRGVLSNEAGMGTAPIAHGIANVKHPAEQGIVGVFEVFTDTIVVCSMTAFIIIASGMWTDPAYQGASGDLTAAALSTSIPAASAIVALCSFLFGFSTLVSWCYYGEKCLEFLAGSRVITPYRVVFTVLVLVGSLISVPLVWAVGTMLNGLMALPNLVGLALLFGTVRKITKDYFDGDGRLYAVDAAATPAAAAPSRPKAKRPTGAPAPLPLHEGSAA